MAGFWTLVLTLLLAVLTTHARREITWRVRIYQGNDTSQSVSYLEENTNYTMLVQMAHENGTACHICGYEFSNNGGFPVMVANMKQYALRYFSVLPTITNFNTALIEDSGWAFQLNTSAAGIVDFTMQSNGVSTSFSTTGNVNDKVFHFGVTWLSSLLALKPTAQLDSIKLASPSSFVAHVVPDVSTIAFGTFQYGSNISDSIMFFSDNFFETYTAVPLVLPFPPQNRCEGSSPFLIDGALFRKSLILNTAMGILRFDSTRKLWENIIPYCTMAFYPSQRPPYRREDCSHVIVAGYKTSSFQTLWRVRPDSNFIEELLDLKNRTISDVFPNIQVAAASSSSIDCGSVTVLVQTQSSYKIIEYTSRKEWKSMFDFPSRINIGGNTAFRKLTAADNSASSAETSAPLVLTGMNYGQSLGKELFFWGNTALFSPDGGISVYQMMELSRDTMVSTFSSANDDSYAMSLSDNSIWFGQVGTKDILQVRPPRISDPGSKSYFKPMFDHDSVIVEVEVMTTGTDLQIRPQLLSLDSAIRRGELISGKSCPYSDIEFAGSFSPDFVRDTTLVNSNEVGLPPEIYLDRFGEYQFTVDVTASPDHADPRSIGLGFIVYGQNSIRVDTQKEMLTSLITRFYVTIVDLGMQEQSLPGESLATSVLKMHVLESHLSCRVINTEMIPVVTSLAVYSGCAPYRHVALLYNASTFACPDSQFDIPCFFFEDVARIKYIVIDDVTNATFEYSDNYRMRVIGGGGSYESIANFSESIILSSNPNYTHPSQHLVWASGYDDSDPVAPVLSINKSEITWICASGSPCYGARPSRSTSADFFFVLEMTTDFVNLRRSYCRHNVKTTIRLYGLPLEFITSIAAVLGSLGGGLFIFGAIVIINRKIEIGKRQRVYPETQPAKNISSRSLRKQMAKVHPSSDSNPDLKGRETIREDFKKSLESLRRQISKKGKDA